MLLCAAAAWNDQQQNDKHHRPNAAETSAVLKRQFGLVQSYTIDLVLMVLPDSVAKLLLAADEPLSEVTKYTWTCTHVVHTLITFYLFHWNKGSPIQEDQGRYDMLTFWEQIDGGLQYTFNRKVLTLMPIIMYVHDFVVVLLFLLGVLHVSLCRLCSVSICSHHRVDSSSSSVSLSVSLCLFLINSFLASCYATSWCTTIAIANFIVLMFAVIPKLAGMHRVRIGGINED
jgi:hypothetical protein